MPSACWPASMPASRCAPATGRNPSPAGGRSSVSLRHSPATRRSCSCRPGTAAPAVVEPVMEKTAAPARKRGIGLWIGAAAAAIVVLAGGGYYALVGDKRRSHPRWRLFRSLRGRQRGAGCAAGGRRPAPQGPGGARQAAHRGGRAREGRAGGGPAQADRGGDAAQDRSRNGRQAAPAGRGAPEGGSRRSGQAEGRGGREEGGRGCRKRLAPAGARATASAGRADRAWFPHRRHRRKFQHTHARDDRGLAEDAQ